MIFFKIVISGLHGLDWQENIFSMIFFGTVCVQCLRH